MKKKNLEGIIYTILASLWWGIIGVIYFKFASFANPIELTVHRTIWTAVLLIVTTSIFSKWKEFFSIIKKKKKYYNSFYYWHINNDKLVYLDLCSFS